MVTADGVRTIGDLIAATGQTMQQMPGAPMQAAGRALDLAGNYINGLSDAAINAVGGSKSNAEVAGHFLSQWLVGNAFADAAIFFTTPVIASIVGAIAVTYGAPIAIAIGIGLTGATIFGAAYVGQELGGLLWDQLESGLQKLNNDPLVLDLDGDGIQLSSLAGSNVHFDFAADGFAERTAWISSGDGILVIDDNNNGAVDSGLELFGSATQDGFAVLETLDSNQDGKIDATDADFGKLRIWRDLNQNGASDSGELQTLSELGIASIALERQYVGGANAGNGIGYEAAFLRTDGTSDTVQSIYLQVDKRHPAPDETNFSPAEGVSALPQFAGSYR